MTNNDILRRIRYLFNFSDLKMIELFDLVEHKVNETDLAAWLRKEDDPAQRIMRDWELSSFLNGLIIHNRGRREGPLPEAEKHLSNNLILRKMRIALDLKTDDILELLDSIDKQISKHELSAFFRNPNHRSYRPCNDQYLRNFFNALQSSYKNK